MNDKTGRRRAPQRAAALAVVAAAALTACSGSPSSSGGRAPAESAAYRANLAFAHCMQAHGVRDFPDPSRSGAASIHGHPPAGTPAGRAYAACQHLLSSSSAAPATPGTPGAEAADCLAAVPACYTPQQFRVAYGIRPLLDHGTDGRGITVALPEQAETGPARIMAVTNIRQDVADFDRRFGLPPARIQVTTTLAGSSASPWLASEEEVEDTEMVHAVAPDATIREILVSPAKVSTPAKFAATFAAYVGIAVRYAAVLSQCQVGENFSMGEDSWTSAEVATMNTALEYAAAAHVTVVAGSGDEGAIGFGSSAPVRQVILPASDPLVLGVGGTILTASPRAARERSLGRWVQPPVCPALLPGRRARHR
jgi:subtilase family serine protease